jgi:hypothetical protein
LEDQNKLRIRYFDWWSGSAAEEAGEEEEEEEEEEGGGGGEEESCYFLLPDSKFISIAQRFPTCGVLVLSEKEKLLETFQNGVS